MLECSLQFNSNKPKITLQHLTKNQNKKHVIYVVLKCTPKGIKYNIIARILQRAALKYVHNTIPNIRIMCHIPYINALVPQRMSYAFKV